MLSDKSDSTRFARGSAQEIGVNTKGLKKKVYCVTDIERFIVVDPTT